jgi:hypothetical protein
MLHQREHDFGYGDKADGKRDNGDGEYITDHSVSNLFRHAAFVSRPSWNCLSRAAGSGGIAKP